jgi:hypothetical protein
LTAEKESVPLLLFGLLKEPVAVKTTTVPPKAFCDVGEKVIPEMLGAATVTEPLNPLLLVTCTPTDVERLLYTFTGGEEGDTTDSETGSAATNDSITVAVLVPSVAWKLMLPDPDPFPVTVKVTFTLLPFPAMGLVLFGSVIEAIPSPLQLPALGSNATRRFPDAGRTGLRPLRCVLAPLSAMLEQETVTFPE